MNRRLRAAARAALIHLACGLTVLSLLACTILWLWFPYPYYQISTGKQLFAILMVVDVACGPLLTLLLFSPYKVKWKWRVDLGIIIFLQIGALAYGISNIAKSRPVFLAYEGDRFRVVYAADIDPKELHKALPQFSRLSWRGPFLVGAKLLDSSDPQYLESLRLALEGNPPSFRPERWVDYSDQKQKLLATLRPLDKLVLNEVAQSSLHALQKESGLPLEAFGYLPLVQDSMNDWIVVVGREDGMPKEFLHLDGW